MSIESSRNSPRFISETILNEPEGWILIKIGRSTSDHIDRYWFSPKLKKKMRSKVELNNFMELLKQCNGDEEIAMQMMKKSKEARVKKIKKEGKEGKKSNNATKKLTDSTKKKRKNANFTPKKDSVEVKRKRGTPNYYLDSSIDNGEELNVIADRTEPYIQEAKLLNLTQERRNRLTFEECAIAAYNEHRRMKATTKPDNMSAFNYEEFPIAEPKIELKVRNNNCGNEKEEMESMDIEILHE